MSAAEEALHGAVTAPSPEIGVARVEVVDLEEVEALEVEVVAAEAVALGADTTGMRTFGLVNIGSNCFVFYYLILFNYRIPIEKKIASQIVMIFRTLTASGPRVRAVQPTEKESSRIGSTSKTTNQSATVATIIT